MAKKSKEIAMISLDRQNKDVDEITPDELELILGGVTGYGIDEAKDRDISSCVENSCTTNSGSCTVNNCGVNSLNCGVNDCTTNTGN